jgi:hypothetical protein
MDAEKAKANAEAKAKANAEVVKPTPVVEATEDAEENEQE